MAPSTTATVERVVTADVYNWTERNPDFEPMTGLSPFVHRTARRGATITVSEAEADRGARLGMLGTADEAAVANDEAAAPPPMPDEQLRALNVDDLVAYVQQRPHEAARVLDLEAARPRQRKTVVEPVATIRDAYEEQLEAAAEAERDAGEPEDLAGGSATAPPPGAPTAPTIPT